MFVENYAQTWKLYLGYYYAYKNHMTNCANDSPGIIVLAK